MHGVVRTIIDHTHIHNAQYLVERCTVGGQDWAKQAVTSTTSLSVNDLGRRLNRLKRLNSLNYLTELRSTLRRLSAQFYRNSGPGLI